MPNWCTNQVSFSSSDEDTIDFIRGAFDSDTPFEILRPEPDWSNTPNDQGIFPGPRYKGNFVSYFPDGSVDDRWYSWRLSNWGTKWDIGNEAFCNQDNDDYLEYEFLTAWGPPDILKTYLEEQHPDLDITWFYHGPGCCLAGYL